MTPFFVVGIVVAASIAVLFGYLSSSKERREAARARELSKYKNRIRKLDSMIIGLPSNYLPKTLKILIYASIVDSLKHVNHLSGTGNLDAQIERVKNTLNQLIKIDSEAPTDCIDEIDPIDLRECKYLLKDLHSLILEFHKEGVIDRNSASSHLEIVRNIMLAVTLDTYNEAALKAATGHNKKLALHYFSTAFSRIQQSKTHSVSPEKFAYFKRKVEQLQLEVASETTTNRPETAPLPDEAVIAEWQALEQEQNSWRKKRY